MSQSRLPFLLRDALVMRYRSEVADGIARLSVFFERPVASGNTNHIDEMDSILNAIAIAQIKLSALDRVVPTSPADNEETNES